MAVYTEVSLSEAQELFQPLGKVIKFDGIKEGVENTNYLVQLSDTKKFILTLFEKRTKEQDLPYFNNLMKLFYDNGISCPLSLTLNKKNLFKIKDKPCCIYSFIEGRPVMKPNLEQLKSLGNSIAQLHQFGDHSELFRENIMLLPSWKFITNQFAKKETKINIKEYKYILNNINTLSDSFPENLRKINIHADLFKDNIFFIDNQVSGFIDFFFSCTDSIIYDLATFVNAWFFSENKFDEKKVIDLSKKDCLYILCGRYEGVDERVSKLVVDEEISVGDYIVSGGEVPAMVISDALIRKIPNVLGSFESIQNETFSLENKVIKKEPVYTRPKEFMGFNVPNVLLSGDHSKIEEWKKDNRF